MNNRFSFSVLLLRILLTLFIGLAIVATGGVAAQQVDVATADLDGTGTQNDPYVITNASELQAMEDDLDAHYTLDNDIDASGTAQWNDGSGFDPIGGDPSDDSTAPAFNGSLDGDNHKITELTISRSDENQVGMFGGIQSATITQLSLVDVTVDGSKRVGALVGKDGYKSNINNIFVTGSIDGSRNSGGLIGQTYLGTIQHTEASVTVSGGLATGGLVGKSLSSPEAGQGTIKNTTVNGTATGDDVVGGLIGRNNALIRAAAVSVDVEATRGTAGGLVGDNFATIQNVKASGNVTGKPFKSGGLAGINLGTIQDADASGNVKGSTSVGGLVGNNRGTIQNAVATGDVNGTDRVGGLVGLADLSEDPNTNIEVAVAAGNVAGSGSVGGLIGATGKNTTIQNTVAAGAIDGSDSVGGLIGDHGGTIRKSFAIGPVNGDSGVGGVIGSTSTTGEVSESYWDEQATGQISSAGNATGLTTEQMTGEAAKMNMTGLDFDSVWQTKPNDYPALRWLASDGDDHSSDSEADIIVATDGSGDYSSIQNAINSANDTARIKLSVGTYKESIEIDKNVTIAAPEGATLTPSPSGSNYSGISIAEHAEPHISGVNIDNFTHGIDAGNLGSTGPANSSWSVTDISIDGNNEKYGSGIHTLDSSGNFTIQDVSINNTHFGIYVLNTGGEWQVQNAKINDTRGGGVIATYTTGDWIVANTSIENTGGDGVFAYDSDSDWVVRSTEMVNTSDGIDAYQSSGKWTVKNTSIEESRKDGINAYDSEGGWVVKSTEITNASDGINSGGSSGNWKITGATVRDQRVDGIDLDDSTGNWKIADTTITNTEADAIFGENTSGDWIITDVLISDAPDMGIEIDDSSGNWSVRNTQISGIGEDGIEAEDTTGDWTIYNNTIRDVGDDAVDASRANGQWKIHESVLANASAASVAADGAIEGNASYNYWGASDGPSGDYTGSGGAAVGNVSVIPFYTDVQLTNLSSEIGEADNGDSGSGYVDVDPSDLTGSGTEADPYVITNASELQAIDDDSDAHYKLGNDIDASGTAEWNGGSGFETIEYFTGHFDGNQYEISGLSIDREETDSVGLFTEIHDATVANVHITNSSVSGRYDVGILAGSNSGEGVIRNVSTTGTVVGADNVGGLIGYNIDSGVVTQSSSSANITVSPADRDTPRAGGLIGGNYNGAIINQSYAIGDVDGVGRTGGLLGENFNNSRVAYSYATGSVNGSEYITGGLVGGNYRGSTVTLSYWDTNTSGLSISDGDATGLTTAQMTGEAAKTNMTGLDFNSVWQTQPDDYPTLRSLPSDDTNDDDSGGGGSGQLVYEEEVLLSGSTITVNTSGASAIAVENLPTNVSISEVSTNGTFNADERSILYSNLTDEGLTANVTFRLDPDDSAYAVGDTVTFSVDRTDVTLTVTAVPQELQGDVTGDQYTAVLDGDDTLSASNLADAINEWADSGEINGTDIGAYELSQLINYWADS